MRPDIDDPTVRRYCRRTNPPLDPFTAVLDCDNNDDEPSVGFIAASIAMRRRPCIRAT
ncbi:hypothetical protein [Nocardia seriolae]|uniref:hypothetical protein n=1 Tax=Nocardia seriolae TaxID=37332 RepID=UPI002953A30B|nr:hypothetical protein [Nocardia seriolae]